ncbi:hypothetical protein SISSUDRAFT_1068099 [Sistotremastrum suecicum HHB10207 ss-3]|uniref:Uncharacterized protein n=1 Tax=Sistotremastrum suecicum HHB10207 ss-3 TaxID=1314776 RepID=A0A165WFR3_9AGAM|nr:hypothetical protein SISSUDRAFT_1068099 [Sistotremastrum suecicum HHB10207 ss-3]
MFEILGTQILGMTSRMPFQCLASLGLEYEKDYDDNFWYAISDDERESEWGGNSWEAWEEKLLKETKRRHDQLLTCLSNRMTIDARLPRLVTGGRFSIHLDREASRQ